MIVIFHFFIKGIKAVNSISSQYHLSIFRSLSLPLRRLNRNDDQVNG